MKQRIEQMKKWIRQQVPEGGKAIIGISGGKDSTIAAALCVLALGKENVIGVRMPNGVQNDINDAREICEHLGIISLEVNIEEAYEGIVDNIAIALNENIRLKNVFQTVRGNGMVRTNLPARLRMSTLYAVAALYPNSRVVNTCNHSEDYVGYSTKYGDAAGDFSPLGGQTVREVLLIGDILVEMGILKSEWVHKIPADGMCGKTDEDNLGFLYEQLDNHILHTGHVDMDIIEKIERLHRATRHKYLPIPTFCDQEEK